MKNYSVIILLILSIVVQAQEENINLKLSGFADTYHAVRGQSPYDFMSSRSRLRTEFSATKNKSYMFASLNSVYNILDESQTKIELREAFFQYTNNSWDFKVGKQIVTWGVADGLRITDIVSPMDYNEFLARDYDDIRIPVNAFRLKYVKPSYNFELLFVPVSEFFVLPVDENNPWSIASSFEIPYTTDMENTPDKNLKNSEFGGRFSFYLRGIDFSVSALNTWNKIPVFRYSYSPNFDTLHLNVNYHRMEMLGFDFSKPVGQFVVRGEVAGYFNELIEFSTTNPINKNTLNALLGIDWYAGNDWTVMVQYYHRLIMNYNVNILSDKNTAYTTMSISKKILRNTLKFGAYSYIDLINLASFTRFSADYALSDQIHLLMGYDCFCGDKGMFSLYNNNSEYWIKAKFNF